MRYLYILGNGFDIGLGLKTKYQDFYQHYLSVPAPNDVIASMKTAIEKERYETWADLEEGLGKYSKNLKDKDNYITCIEDLKLNLASYLKNQVSDVAQLLEANIEKNLFRPYDFLEPAHKRAYLDMVPDPDVDSRKFSVITLNYTETLESIVRKSNHNNIFNINIVHLHGKLDGSMALGVNDVFQLANDAFRNDDDVVELAVKPEFNDACMNVNNRDCENLISQAQTIVLYGTSLGATDKKWWYLIGQRMASKGTCLMYFPYDESKDVEQLSHRKRRWVKEYVCMLKEKMDMQSIPNVDDRIFIGLNKPIFKAK